jgi:hypothetical protein
MNKEVIIALIKKDIEELGVIAQGLYETTSIPPMIISLASKKTQDVLQNLAQLAQIKAEPIENKTVQSESEKPAEVEVKKEDIPLVAQKEEVLPTTNLVKEEITQKEKDEKPEEKKSTLAEKIGVKGETKAETISKKKDTNSLGNTIANKKITDIKQAISIADRFRFQRELFSGNADVMNKVLSEIDAFESYELAMAYIQENYQWDAKNEHVNDFFVILHRRFS